MYIISGEPSLETRGVRPVRRLSRGHCAPMGGLSLAPSLPPSCALALVQSCACACARDWACVTGRDSLLVPSVCPLPCTLWLRVRESACACRHGKGSRRRRRHTKEALPRPTMYNIRGSGCVFICGSICVSICVSICGSVGPCVIDTHTLTHTHIHTHIPQQLLEMREQHQRKGVRLEASSPLQARDHSQLFSPARYRSCP